MSKTPISPSAFEELKAEIEALMPHKDAPELSERAYRRACIDVLSILAAHVGSDQAIAGGGWMPIESAPRDITRILAWDGDSVEVIEYGDDWCSHGCYVPTHWMPLPPQPKE